MTAGYNPHFDLDRAYGEAAEGSLRDTLHLLGDRFEVKRKRRIDDKFYVEVQQSPGGNGAYKPSGINITRATYWAYEVGETGLFVLVGTDLLRLATRRSSVRAEERDGDNPTRGRLVSFGDFLAAADDLGSPALAAGVQAAVAE